jgi:putative photosynthetic complex assembly protein
MSETHTARVHATPEELVPRVLVRIMFALVLACVGLVTIATLSDRPLESTPADTAIIAQRDIVLTGEASGAARVMDVHGSVIANCSAEKGGFVAGVERVIARERAKIGADATAPVQLQLRTGNRLSLYDPSTGWSAELMGFGADNTRTFARLLGTH